MAAFSLLLLSATWIIGIPGPSAIAFHNATYQVGVNAQGLRLSTGFRSRITTVLPHSIQDDAWAYFWVGGYTEGSDFLQIGWGTHTARYEGDCGSDKAFVFAAKRDPIGNYDHRIGACGSAGVNGEAHTYSLERVAIDPDGTSFWMARIDGTDAFPDPFVVNGTTTGTSEPFVYAELSRAGLLPFGLPSLADQMGPAQFNPALEARLSGTESWRPAEIGLAQIDAPCPPYGMTALSLNSVVVGNTETIGSDQACPNSTTMMWSFPLRTYWFRGVYLEAS